MRNLILPLLVVIFAYLELGGNYYAAKLIEKPTTWNVVGTILFSVAYSLVTAICARVMEWSLPLLMVNYGFGFTIVAIFLTLEWGELPKISGGLISAYPLLWIVGGIASIGFLLSGYILVAPKQ